MVVVLGIVLAPYLLDAIAPGFEGEKRVVTMKLVRILFTDFCAYVHKSVNAIRAFQDTECNTVGNKFFCFDRFG